MQEVHNEELTIWKQEDKVGGRVVGKYQMYATFVLGMNLKYNNFGFKAVCDDSSDLSN